MKKSLLTVTVALMVGATIATITPSFADQASFGAGAGAHVRGHGNGSLEKLAEKLNLTDAQKGQIKTIFQTERPKIKAIRENTTLTPEDKKEQLKAERKDMMSQVKAILTPDQLAQLKAMRREHKGAGAAANDQDS